MDLSLGTTIAGYTIDEVAGRGGMGVVYSARQERPNRTVALKVINPELAADPQFRTRFEREADIAASIEHPNVIPIYGAGEENGLLFLAMRFVKGVDLRAFLINEGPMQPARAARIVAQVGDALDAAHASGLVHRDIKPGNILLAERDGRDHVYLTDFGLTKESSSAAGLTKTGTWVGTADYVAPEQIKGEQVNARADVYALGCVLFQLLVGDVPFERDSEVSKIFAHLNDPPPSLAQIAPRLERFDNVIARAMAKDPKDRFASAGDLGRAAVAVAEMRPVDVPERSVAVGPAAAGARPADPFATKADEPSAGATVPAPGYGQPAEPPPRVEPPAAPPPVTPPTPVAQPQFPPAGPTGAPQQSGRLLKVLLGVLAGLLVAGGIAAGVIFLTKDSGPDDKQLVRKALANYHTTSGSEACDFATPAFLNSAYGSEDGCRRENANAPAQTLGGTQSIKVTGNSASVTGLTVNSHPYKAGLVKQNGEWLLDSETDLDQEAAQAQVEDYYTTTGSKSCDFFAQKYLDIEYGGSIERCQRDFARSGTNPVSSHESFEYVSATEANDDVKLDSGSKVTVGLAKQSDGTWLITGTKDR